MEVIEEIKFKNGLTGQLHYDTDPMNPRHEWDHQGTMVCFHRNYELGDKNHRFKQSDYGSWAELEQGIKDEVGPCVILPLYLYDHSGITISTEPFGCPWDSGKVGFIYISWDKAKYEHGWKRRSRTRELKLREWLKGEVEEYDMYLTGQVYGYTLEDEDGEQLDSCWGFFGLEYAEEELRMSAEHWVPIQPKLPGFEGASCA